MLTEENEKFAEFGIAGLCNLCIGNYEQEIYHTKLQYFYSVTFYRNLFSFCLTNYNDC